jgi:hypothetical protein
MAIDILNRRGRRGDTSGRSNRSYDRVTSNITSEPFTQRRY